MMISPIGVFLIATAMIVFTLVTYFWKIRVQSYLQFIMVIDAMVILSLGVLLFDLPEVTTTVAILAIVVPGLLFLGYNYYKLIGRPYQGMYAKMVRAVDNKNLDIGTSVEGTSVGEMQKLEEKQIQFINDVSEILNTINRNHDVIDGYLDNLDKQSQSMGEDIDEITDDVDQILQNAAIISEQIDTLRKQGADFLDTTESNFEVLEEINKSADRISDQTNIIAVNAAIEASQSEADDSNFGTVAEAILSLSRRSRETTDKFQNHIVNLRKALINEIEDMNSKLQQLEDAIFELGELANRSSSFTHQQQIYANEINATSKQAKDTNDEFTNITKPYQLD